jgi:hypothetical protein
MCLQGDGWCAAGSCSVRCPRQDSQERKGLQANVGRSLKRKRTASDAILCLCFGYATDRPARRRPKAAAARCAGRARGGRSVTGRSARQGFDDRRRSPSRLRHCCQGHWRGRLHAEHMLERAGKPSETVIVARELTPWRVGGGGQDQAQCV